MDVALRCAGHPVAHDAVDDLEDGCEVPGRHGHRQAPGVVQSHLAGGPEHVAFHAAWSSHSFLFLQPGRASSSGNSKRARNPSKSATAVPATKPACPNSLMPVVKVAPCPVQVRKVGCVVEPAEPLHALPSVRKLLEGQVCALLKAQQARGKEVVVPADDDPGPSAGVDDAVVQLEEVVVAAATKDHVGVVSHDDDFIWVPPGGLPQPLHVLLRPPLPAAPR
eukprot:CAMPEP_0171278990 /NCGR_PEP_ID=MMETSP0790-20130122/65154_1 /TAXON_ID=2925 /ORGANISM="Alexandrium catenella, Strain OF101" /LENGTH=221 /DNA_ID=CAMNT_0011748165 /DNA_START=254 /DNA_END=920 /DNA_ORIENTATION=-